MSATHEERQGHTAGPWWISGKSIIRAGKDSWIADVNWRNREANARLIAAAPEMLAALKEARTTLSLTRSNIMTEMKRGRGYQWEGVPELLQQRIDAADAAIASAEGR